MHTPSRVDATNATTEPFRPRPQHEMLARWAGTWSGPTRTWLDPSGPPEESFMHATIELLLGGRFLRIDYQSTAMGKPHAGRMIVGFHADPQRYEIAWIDSFHTGSSIMQFAGPLRADGAVSALGSYTVGDQTWGWRTALREEADGTLVVEAFNIEPGAAEERAIETRLVRKA